MLSAPPRHGDDCGVGVPDYPLPHLRIPLVAPLIASQGYAFARSDRRQVDRALDWADVVHLEEPFMLQVFVARRARARGVPALATYHIHPENLTASVYLDRCPLLNRVILEVWKCFIFNRCDLIQCPSQSVYDRVLRLRVRPSLLLVSNGVPLDGAVGGDGRQVGESCLIRILAVGRFSREKDQATILKAMRHSRYASQIQLVLAGRGPTEKSLRRAASRLVRDGVLKHAPSFDFFDAAGLDAQAEQADLYIHAAFIEVEGLSCLEVLRHGVVPVIAQSPLTATSQFALDAHSRFKARDPKALARAIDYWLSDNDRRQTEAQKYLNIGAHYDINDCVSRLELVYRKLASGKAS